MTKTVCLVLRDGIYCARHLRRIDLMDLGEGLDKIRVIRECDRRRGHIVI